MQSVHDEDFTVELHANGTFAWNETSDCQPKSHAAQVAGKAVGVAIAALLAGALVVILTNPRVQVTAPGLVATLVLLVAAISYIIATIATVMLGLKR